MKNEIKFNKWVENCLHRKMEYGTFDCGLMAAEVIETQLGKHPCPELVGSYYTPLGAYRILKNKNGFSAMLDNLFKRIPINRADGGDIILCWVDNDKKETLTVCTGLNLLVMGNPYPILTHRKNLNMKIAWRIE